MREKNFSESIKQLTAMDGSPVVAQKSGFLIDKELGEPHSPRRLIARQDIEDLRNEQAIYRAALALVLQSGQQDYDCRSGQQLMESIAANIKDWPRQWEREKLLRGGYNQDAFGWGLALTLAEIAPDKAQAILVRGREYGES